MQIERDADLFALVAIVLSLVFAIILQTQAETENEIKLYQTARAENVLW